MSPGQVSSAESRLLTGHEDDVDHLRRRTCSFGDHASPPLDKEVPPKAELFPVSPAPLSGIPHLTC